MKTKRQKAYVYEGQLPTELVPEQFLDSSPSAKEYAQYLNSQYDENVRQFNEQNKPGFWGKPIGKIIAGVGGGLLLGPLGGAVLAAGAHKYDRNRRADAYQQFLDQNDRILKGATTYREALAPFSNSDYYQQETGETPPLFTDSRLLRPGLEGTYGANAVEFGLNTLPGIRQGAARESRQSTQRTMRDMLNPNRSQQPVYGLKPRIQQPENLGNLPTVADEPMPIRGINEPTRMGQILPQIGAMDATGNTTITGLGANETVYPDLPKRILPGAAAAMINQIGQQDRAGVRQGFDEVKVPVTTVKDLFQTEEIRQRTRYLKQQADNYKQYINSVVNRNNRANRGGGGRAASPLLPLQEAKALIGLIDAGMKDFQVPYQDPKTGKVALRNPVPGDPEYEGFKMLSQQRQRIIQSVVPGLPKANQSNVRQLPPVAQGSQPTTGKSSQYKPKTRTYGNGKASFTF